MDVNDQLIDPVVYDLARRIYVSGGRSADKAIAEAVEFKAALVKAGVVRADGPVGGGD